MPFFERMLLKVPIYRKNHYWWKFTPKTYFVRTKEVDNSIKEIHESKSDNFEEDYDALIMVIYYCLSQEGK